MTTRGSAEALEMRRMIGARLLRQGRGVRGVDRLVGVAPAAVSHWRQEGVEALRARPRPARLPELSADRKAVRLLQQAHPGWPEVGSLPACASKLNPVQPQQVRLPGQLHPRGCGGSAPGSDGIPRGHRPAALTRALVSGARAISCTTTRRSSMASFSRRRTSSFTKSLPPARLSFRWRRRGSGPAPSGTRCE